MTVYVFPGQVSLGSAAFREEYGVRYAYVIGGMYRGISSVEMVLRASRAGVLAFFGAGELALEKTVAAIHQIRRGLPDGQPFGVNLLNDPTRPELEEPLVDVLVREGVRTVEAAGYVSMTAALVRYRAKGLRRLEDGTVAVENRILAKVSRTEVAEAFLRPAPEQLVEQLVQEGRLSREEALLLLDVPMADDLIVQADGGWFTEQETLTALLPSVARLRDEAMRVNGYRKRVRVGAAGGIGSPEAAAAAFLLGAEFVVTGSINQCTVEADTSAAVKDLLQQAQVPDTDLAPAGPMFELGMKMRVLKKGLYFPNRAQRLYDLYRTVGCLEGIDAPMRRTMEERFFGKSLAEVEREMRVNARAQDIEKWDKHPRNRLAAVCKRYLDLAAQRAQDGNRDGDVTGNGNINGHPDGLANALVPCGQAMGAGNAWLKGTAWEKWQHRHAEEIGVRLMEETAALLQARWLQMAEACE